MPDRIRATGTLEPELAGDVCMSVNWRHKVDVHGQQNKHFQENVRHSEDGFLHSCAQVLDSEEGNHHSTGVLSNITVNYIQLIEKKLHKELG